MTSLGFPAQFDQDISQVIASYITDIPYMIRPEFANKKEPHEMYWNLSHNESPHVIPILAAKLPGIEDDIDWFALSSHKYLTYEFLKANANNIVWAIACRNPACVDFLLDNPRYIRWCGLSHNPDPRAISMLKANLNKADIDWYVISSRKDMIDVIEDNLDKVNWCEVSANPAAIHILERNPDKIDFNNIARNSAAMDIIRKNMGRTNMNILCRNIAACNVLIPAADILWSHIVNLDEKAVDIIRELLKDPNNWFIIDRLNWNELSSLPYAIDIIEVNIHKVFWTMLSSNPAAIHILEKNKDKIYWNGLSMNPAAIDILLDNPSKVKWTLLYKHNTSIFDIDRVLYKKHINEATIYIYNL